MCTTEKMANKPNVIVIQKSVESAGRFSSSSSLIAAEIKGGMGEQVEI